MATLAPVAPAPARPPGYYVRQRLLQNRPAVAGAVFIALCALVALLGYWVLPDNSPDANNGFVQLQKQPPGLRVSLLRRSLPDSLRPDSNIFSTWLHGQVPQFQETPVGHFRQLSPDSVEIRTWTAFGTEPAPLQRLAIHSSTTPLIHQSTYWLGTDKAGRDELSRLLLGTRISLGIGLVAVLISMVLGMAIGALAGYFGGKIDALLLGLMTVVWSIPGIMLVIAISLALDSKGVWVSFVAVGLTMWVDVARVVRGQVLGLRSATFI